MQLCNFSCLFSINFVCFMYGKWRCFCAYINFVKYSFNWIKFYYQISFIEYRFLTVIKDALACISGRICSRGEGTSMTGSLTGPAKPWWVLWDYFVSIFLIFVYFFFVSTFFYLCLFIFFKKVKKRNALLLFTHSKQILFLGYFSLILFVVNYQNIYIFC